MATAAAAHDVLAAYRAALHAHDEQRLLRVYADDAVVVAYSERSRPASPQRIEGREAIDAWLTDVMSRNLTHTVNDELAAGDRFAFRETCVYPSGENVVGTYVCKVRDGQIVEQVGVEAWDE
jgi:ketosteroid isomerase-like protein